MPSVRRLVLVLAAFCLLLVGLAPTAAAQAQSDLPSGRTDYRTYDDYVADMAALVAARPDLVSPFTLPEQTSSGRTVHGIEITNDVTVNDGKPVFALVGEHHGNEWPAGELVMEWAIELVQSADDPAVADLLDRARVVVVPIVNVDGHIRGRRQTDTNVDMNRNYGLGWLPISTGGAAPWSEPETRNIKWLLETRQATVFVTQHTCIQVVLYPPLQLAAGPTQDEPRFIELASEMAGYYGNEYMQSAQDYETTGEAIDWAYYATRGLALTVETCPERSEGRTFQTQVIDDYPGHRQAMFTALRHTADTDQHARISGTAPQSAVLEVSKSFELWTSPFEQPDGTTRPLSFGNTLTSDMEVTDPSGAFTMAVNPSYRPIPAYQETGLEGGQTDFYDEPWTLTCARPDGTVIQSEQVRVDLGEVADVDLGKCERHFDPCPQPDTSATVVVGGVDTGVANRDSGYGCTINQLLADTSRTDTGTFVQHVNLFLRDLHGDGVIDGHERGALTRAAVAERRPRR